MATGFKKTIRLKRKSGMGGGEREVHKSNFTSQLYTPDENTGSAAFDISHFHTSQNF